MKNKIIKIFYFALEILIGKNKITQIWVQMVNALHVKIRTRLITEFDPRNGTNWSQTLHTSRLNFGSIRTSFSWTPEWGQKSLYQKNKIFILCRNNLPWHVPHKQKIKEKNKYFNLWLPFTNFYTFPKEP